jgi:acetyltransferase-like isoleucine patch superfamily enzyme
MMAAIWRVSVTVVAIVSIELVVCTAAALPVVAVWTGVMPRLSADPLVRSVLFAALLIPSYIGFALCLMATSAAATRLTGARTPPDTMMRISDLGWPLMRWVRYMVASHLVRVLAGTVFRGSPIWTAYLRLNGAKLGKHVYVNSLFVSDHNLLEFGDGSVIGSEVHLSGHTVEGGVIKTGRVRLGRDVTIGLGSVVDIGVTIGDRCQVGALSLVPKYTTLESGQTYAGIPVRRLDPQAADASTLSAS